MAPKIYRDLSALGPVMVCSVVSTSNFVFANINPTPGYLENFGHGAELELNFLNFITSVPGKLHCTLEVTNCPGQSQVTDTGPGRAMTITRNFLAGQFPMLFCLFDAVLIMIG